MHDEIINDYDPLKNVSELSLVKHIRRLVEGDWLNGTIVASTRQSDQIQNYEKTGASGQTRDQRRQHGLHGHKKVGDAVGKPIANEATAAKVIQSDHPIDLL